MENTNRDTAITAAPQYDWNDIQTEESFNMEPNHNISDDYEEEISIYAMSDNDDPDPKDKDDDDEDDDEDDNDNEDDEEGDWGHVDPAEGNSPFPDSNDPSGPGSAV